MRYVVALFILFEFYAWREEGARFNCKRCFKAFLAGPRFGVPVWLLSGELRSVSSVIQSFLWIRNWVKWKTIGGRGVLRIWFGIDFSIY